MSEPVNIGSIARKRNPLGIVVCVAFIVVAAIYAWRYHDWLFPLIFVLIGLPFLLVKEHR